MDLNEQAQQEEDAKSIADQMERLVQCQGNVYEAQKYVTPTMLMLAPQSQKTKGFNEAANLARDEEEEYDAVENPFKTVIEDIIMQKPDLAFVIAKSFNHDKSGAVLNQLREFDVWVKKGDTWKMHVSIYNTLPID